MAKNKKYTYYVEYSFILNGEKTSYTTQLYQIGIYIIWDGKPEQQGRTTPMQLAKLAKTLDKDAKSGKITVVKKGRIITVIDRGHGWEEVKS